MKQMAESFWQRLTKSTLKNGDKQQKAKYPVWVIPLLLAAGIYFMYLSSGSREEMPKVAPSQRQIAEAAGNPGAYREQLEEELRACLLSVKGVRDVRVFIALESGPVYSYLQDTEYTKRSTEEEDGSGGTRIIGEETERSQTVMVQGGGGQQAVVEKAAMPQVAGVMVTVKGEGGIRLLEEVDSAVRAALNLPAHRVKVLPME